MVAYYISAFLEVEAIKVGCDAWRELRNIGNLFETEEQAREAALKVKSILITEQ